MYDYDNIKLQFQLICTIKSIEKTCSYFTLKQQLGSNLIYSSIYIFISQEYPICVFNAWFQLCFIRLDETDALCSFYYLSTHIIETSKSVCGEVSGINEPIDKYEIRNPAVTLGEMLGFFKYAKYDSFNADGFCKAHATKNEFGFKFVDLSLERKENCSVYEIWKLENVIIDECLFDENLDLCSAMQGMVNFEKK